MFTQDDLDKLEKAISTGARSVEYSNGKVEYRSLAEMLQTRELMRRELGQNVPAIATAKPKTSKGLC